MNDTLASPASTMMAGPSRDALTTAIQALDLAERNGHPALRTLALSQVARCYRGLGMLDAAEEYCHDALHCAKSVGSTDQTIELLCDAADYAVTRADTCRALQDPQGATLARDRAHAFCVEAASMAHHTSDPAWEVTVLLRASDLLDRCGDHSEAIAMQCRALNLIAEEKTQPQQAPASHFVPSRFLM